VTPERDEQQVLQAGFQAPPGTRNPLAVPGMEGGILITAGVTFSAEDYGLHTLEVYLDARRLRSILIAVRPPSELGEAAGTGEESEG
jgi:hypothetical protein